MMMLLRFYATANPSERYVGHQCAQWRQDATHAPSDGAYIGAEHSQPTPAFMMLVRYKVITALNITR
jgi:hypothetical protein